MRERKDPYAKILSVAQKRRELKAKLENEAEKTVHKDKVHNPKELEHARALYDEAQSYERRMQEQTDLMNNLLDRGTALDEEILEVANLMPQPNNKIPMYVWITGALILGLFLGWSGIIQLGF